MYVLHVEVDGTGYPLGYLFLDNNGNGVSGARTNVIAKFLGEFRTRGIFPQFFLTDKDFAQISAGRGAIRIRSIRISDDPSVKIRITD